MSVAVGSQGRWFEGSVGQQQATRDLPTTAEGALRQQACVLARERLLAVALAPAAMFGKVGRPMPEPERKPSTRIKLFSLWFWSYLIVALTLFWFAVVIPWLLITPFDRRRRFSHWYAYTWANHLHRVSPFWTVVVDGVERMRDDQAYVLVCNHQSSGDILAMFALRKQFRWVAKRELFAVPFLGWMMAMAGYIGIKRGDKRSRERMFARCRRQLELGNTVAMFPEGTRSTTKDMRPFKPGAFVLACETHKPVLPVIMEGTLETLPRASWVFTLERKIYPVVRVLEPIDPASVDHDPERLSAAVRAAMVEGIAKLRAEIEARGGLEVPPPA